MLQCWTGLLWIWKVNILPWMVGSWKSMQNMLYMQFIGFAVMLSSLIAVQMHVSFWLIEVSSFSIFLLVATTSFSKIFSSFHFAYFWVYLQILDQYKESIDARTKEGTAVYGTLPKSVILVGHSMGGFVARAATVHPNLRKKAVETIVTLSSPHQWVISYLLFDKGGEGVVLLSLNDRPFQSIYSYKIYLIQNPSCRVAAIFGLLLRFHKSEMARRISSPSL